jgi:hypothetical protein
MRTLVKIDTAATSTELVAAVAGQVVSVVAYNLVAAAPVTAQFKSGTTALTGPMSMIAGTPLRDSMVDSSTRDCLFQTAKGEALNLTLGTAIQVSGHMVVEKSS